MVDVAVCCTAFIMLCLCALVFAILRHFPTFSWCSLPRLNFKIITFSATHPHSCLFLTFSWCLLPRKSGSSSRQSSQSSATCWPTLTASWWPASLSEFLDKYLSSFWDRNVFFHILIRKCPFILFQLAQIYWTTFPQCGGILIRKLFGPMEHHLAALWWCQNYF